MEEGETAALAALIKTIVTHGAALAKNNERFLKVIVSLVTSFRV